MIGNTQKIGDLSTRIGFLYFFEWAKLIKGCNSDGILEGEGLKNSDI